MPRIGFLKALHVVSNKMFEFLFTFCNNSPLVGYRPRMQLKCDLRWLPGLKTFTSGPVLGLWEVWEKFVYRDFFRLRSAGYRVSAGHFFTALCGLARVQGRHCGCCVCLRSSNFEIWYIQKCHIFDLTMKLLSTKLRTCSLKGQFSETSQ